MGHVSVLSHEIILGEILSSVTLLVFGILDMMMMWHCQNSAVGWVIWSNTVYVILYHRNCICCGVVIVL